MFLLCRFLLPSPSNGTMPCYSILFELCFKTCFADCAVGVMEVPHDFFNIPYSVLKYWQLTLISLYICSKGVRGTLQNISRSHTGKSSEV